MEVLDGKQQIEMIIAMEILLYQLVSDQSILVKHLQLRRPSIVNVSLILTSLKQFDKVIFPLLLSFLFLLLSSVFSTI